tara:strand:+ start:807 stop:965 length:159 start_codon:yes stop_codon:yes gene_type:complete
MNVFETCRAREKERNRSEKERDIERERDNEIGGWYKIVWIEEDVESERGLSR